MLFIRYMFFVMVSFSVIAYPAFADVATGNPAPDFTLTDTQGQSVSLSDHKGKYVVLEWVNYDCPFVQKHYKTNSMQSLQKDLTQQGVVWLSINSSAEGKQGHFSVAEINEKIIERRAVPTAYLLDTNGTVGKTYGAQTTPHMFIINPDGVLIYQGAIDDQPSFNVEDIPIAYNFVRAAIKEAMEGQAVSSVSTKSYGCSVKY